MNFDRQRTFKRLLSGLSLLWESDLALVALLVLLVAYIFLLYPLTQVGVFRNLTQILFSLILLSGALTVSRNKLFRTLVWSWCLLTLALLWFKFLLPNRLMVYPATILALFYLALLTLFILNQVLRTRNTNSRRIMGAVAAYLLIGMIWSLVYYLIAVKMPNSFNGLDAGSDVSHEVLRTHFQYFSFVVLTSMGFGDIIPVSPIARMAVSLEAVVGQLFPAILIARLVSLHVQSDLNT